MWQHPKLVVHEKLEDYYLEAGTSDVLFSHPLVSGGGVYAPRKTTITDPKFQGILGFPSLGTSEIGDQLYDALGGWVADMVADYCYGTIVEGVHVLKYWRA